jgi:hypothetical protein
LSATENNWGYLIASGSSPHQLWFQNETESPLPAMKNLFDSKHWRKGIKPLQTKDKDAGYLFLIPYPQLSRPYLAFTTDFQRPEESPSSLRHHLDSNASFKVLTRMVPIPPNILENILHATSLMTILHDLFLPKEIFFEFASV